VVIPGLILVGSIDMLESFFGFLFLVSVTIILIRVIGRGQLPTQRPVFKKSDVKYFDGDNT